MKKSTIFLILGYALLLVGGFIGVPKQPFLVYAIAFAIYTAFYWLLAYYVKSFTK